jgi:hypothetical protein
MLQDHADLFGLQSIWEACHKSAETYEPFLSLTEFSSRNMPLHLSADGTAELLLELPVTDVLGASDLLESVEAEKAFQVHDGHLIS